MIVRFTAVRQHTQQVGGDDEHLSADVLCSIEVPGKAPVEVIVAVKATVGDVGEQPLEVGLYSYAGPIDASAFRREVEAYYRTQVGSRGRGIRIEGASDAQSAVQMGNNDIPGIKTVFLPMPPEGGASGAW